ncbi:MAG: hypothetical protein WAM14_06520 [Candidatus Nitrosopolaris sp.]
MQTRENPELLVSQLGVRVEDYNVEFSQLSSWIDSDPTALNQSIYISIIFPIYCKIARASSNEIGKFLAKYIIHQSLRRDCTATIQSADGRILKRLKLTDPSLLQNSLENHDKMNRIIIPVLSPISPNTSVQVEVRHNMLGIISSNKLSIII